jgi:hypothetical protein
MAQICRIICAHVPFWGIVIVEINVLPKSGHATLCAFFITCTHAQIHDTINAHKKMKKSRRQIWQNVIILLSFCYHLED